MSTTAGQAAARVSSSRADCGDGPAGATAAAGPVGLAAAGPVGLVGLAGLAGPAGLAGGRCGGAVAGGRGGPVRGRRRVAAEQRVLEPLDPRQQRRGGRIHLRRGGLDQDELELDAGLGSVGGRIERARDEVQQPHHVGAGQRLGLSLQALVTLGGHPQLLGHLLQDLDGEQLPTVDLKVTEHLARVPARPRQLGRRPDRLRRVVGNHRVEGFEQLLGIRHPEHREHVSAGDRLLPGVGQQLLERAERVTEAARGVAGDQRHRGGVDLDLLPGGDPPEDGGNLLDGGATEVEAVAAVHDGGQHLLGLGRGQHEDRARRRLLQRLEEGVPCLRREHVGLVEDVDLVAARNGGIGDALAQIADVVDRVVRGRVHLDHVERGGIGDRYARVADAAGLDRGAVLAVQAGSEDLRGARLPGPARADEQVGVMDLSPGHRVAQRAHDLLLSDDVGEGPGTMAAVERWAG